MFLNSLKLAQSVVKILDSKKAQDIQAIKIRNLTIVSDYFIIASATSTTQVKALVDEVDYRLSELGIKPERIEGYQSASWIILDYLDVVVHIFYTQTREFYSLERLWADGEKLELDNLLNRSELD
jgi:ribosome-associated protein